MFKFLQELQLPLCFLCNKIDKLSNNDIAKTVTHTKDIFFGQMVLPVSAKSKV
jgi:GTP-binding protein EngB required for normal cell division